MLETTIATQAGPAAHLDALNPDQRRAVEHGAGPQQGPLLIIAGAGSGKTNTLAHRVAHLILDGVDPRRILLLTFSRRAAAEMARRVERVSAKVLGDKAGTMTDALAWAGTFHGVGARLLREYAHEIGLDPAFTIHDREDSADLMNLVRSDLGFAKTERRFPTKGTCLAIYSRCVNAEAPLEEVLGRSFPWCAAWTDALRSVFAAYVETKQAQGVLDYDDLLLYWAQTVGDADLAAQIGGRFDHVMVDEYQDTNRLQSSILLALKPDGRGLTVVGDDAQSIYSFRAATVRNILDFPGHFDPPATIVTLERNYRSTQPVLAAANAVIGFASERLAKTLWSERKRADEAEDDVVYADGQGVRVLVVEDNVDVGAFAVQSLSDLGYVPVLAADATAALAKLVAGVDTYDVVFSDVMMPGINGIELGQEIRRLYDDLPVVLTSGYSHVLAQNGTFGFELLHKPYSVEQLSKILTKAARQRRRGALS